MLNECKKLDIYLLSIKFNQLKKKIMKHFKYTKSLHCMNSYLKLSKNLQ